MYGIIPYIHYPCIKLITGRASTGNDNLLAALDVIEQHSESLLCFKSIDLVHRSRPLRSVTLPEYGSVIQVEFD